MCRRQGCPIDQVPVVAHRKPGVFSVGKRTVRRGVSMVGAAAVVVGVVVGGGVVGAGTASAYCQENPEGGCYNDSSSSVPEPVSDLLVVVLTALLPVTESSDRMVETVSQS